MRVNRSVVTISVLVTALIGTLALALVRPVAAQTTVTNPVKIVTGYANGPHAVPNTMTQIRALPLPVGKWAVSAKLFVEGGTYADCKLWSGNNYDTAKTGLDGTSGTITGTLHMTIVRWVTGPGVAARVSCTDQGSTMNWWFLKITAISGGSISNTAFTP